MYKLDGHVACAVAGITGKPVWHWLAMQSAAQKCKPEHTSLLWLQLTPTFSSTHVDWQHSGIPLPIKSQYPLSNLSGHYVITSRCAHCCLSGASCWLLAATHGKSVVRRLHTCYKHSNMLPLLAGLHSVWWSPAIWCITAVRRLVGICVWSRALCSYSASCTSTELVPAARHTTWLPMAAPA